MSDTLDRLKALNTKLEAKLSKKKIEKRGEKQQGPSKAKEPVETLPEESSVPAEEAPVILRGQTLPGNAPHSKSPEGGDEAAEVRRLTQILIHSLRVDAAAEPVRAQNLQELSKLYLKLGISKKVPAVHDLFIYKAMNISGIGLKEEDFGEIREGKYVQIIAITYEPDKNGKKKAKNISLGYFGKAESLGPPKKNQVIEFVLRWRYEKAFQNLEHYRHLLGRVCPAAG